MARTADIDELVDHVNALERCATDLALARADAAPAARSGTAAHGAARLLRAAARRFPLLALAGAFGLGVYVGSQR